MFFLVDSHDIAFMIENDKAGAGRSLVNGCDKIRHIPSDSE
jgi:hypothetical protein